MKTRSNIMKRLLSLALCICMVLALVPAINLTTEAATEYIVVGTKLCLKPNSNWKTDGARFAAYFFGTGETWVDMYDPDGDGIYTCTVPSGNWTNVIFCRMNPGNTSNSWATKWNQTGDLTVGDYSKTKYTVKEGYWDSGSNGTWSAADCANIGHAFGDDYKCDRCDTEGRVIYFQNNWLWTNVQLYYFNDKGNNCWPGEPMKEYEGVARTGNSTTYGYYSMVIPADSTYFIISGTNDKGEFTQSIDIPATTYYDGITYYMKRDESLDVNKNSYGTFAICEDFADEHRVDEATNICSRCKKACCMIYDHKYDVCTKCGGEQVWVFFEYNEKWDNVYLYYWYEDSSVNNAWPGDRMAIWRTITGGTSASSYLKLQIPANVKGIVINNGLSEAAEIKTPDILVSDLEGGKLYNGITFKKNGNKIESYEMAHTDCSVYHIYGETTYTWADDYSTCTATRSCIKCGNKTDTEVVSSAKEVLAVADCQIFDKAQYDAVYDWYIPWTEAQQIVITGEKNPNNHVDEKAVYVDNGDGTHDLEWLCCEAHVETDVEHIDENVKNGYCDNCNVLLAPVQLMKTSASLEGNISVNYFMLLSEEVINDESAYIQFTVAGRDPIKIPVSQSQVIDGYHVFSCEVNAKEMTDIISMQFFYGGNAALAEPHPYNVRAYAKHIMKNYDDEETRNLMEAMVNYGAASQKYFGYDEDNLANSIQDDKGNELITSPDYDNVKIENFDVKRGQGTEKVKFYSASLVLNSKTTLRLFFTGPVSVTLEGEELEVTKRGKFYYADVVDISAKDLDENVTVTINDGTDEAVVIFNPMAYCQSIQEDTTGSYSTEMKNLACALYLYNKAANEYFDKEG